MGHTPKKVDNKQRRKKILSEISKFDHNSKQKRIALHSKKPTKWRKLFN